MKENILDNRKPLSNYKPLIVIITIILLASFALEISTIEKNSMNIMRNFMGLFFTIFSMFKLFNIEGFVKGFKKYDLLSIKFNNYGYVYPYIELILGLGYLSNASPILVNSVSFIVMSASAYSVIKSIKQGLDLRCACLGTMLNVPLSTVSVIENVGMSAMSLLMLFNM
ncbi:MAG: MauE/DoxX family redox-associated membrane protein [Alphaproteobacteria bacterium]